MKLLIVKSAVESRWGSCKVISPNLHQVYNKLASIHEIQWFSLPQELLKEELQSDQSIIYQLVKKLDEFKPDRLVFVDHFPSPPTVLAYLSILKNLRQLPPLVFHIYGDFTYFAREWVYLNDVMENHPVTFVVASESQRRQVSHFVNEVSAVKKFCFPVNAKEYYFDSKEREQVRKDQNLAEEDFVILYSGRISLQKNVDVLIKEFADLKMSNAHLWIVGAFDDVGADFMGIESYPGYMFAKINSLLSSITPEQRKRIKFWGHQKKESLRKIKSASDCYASLSLYHDEDYGMSPAEALSVGLKSVLTDWGGYSSFENLTEWKCELVSVDISEYGLEISNEELKSFFIKASKEKDSSEQRALRSKAFLSQFSIENNVDRLRDILEIKPVPFQGFNWYLNQYAEALNQNWSRAKFNKFLVPKKNSFYSDVYNNYISRKFSKNT